MRRMAYILGALGLAAFLAWPARSDETVRVDAEVTEVPIDELDREHWAYAPLADCEPPTVEDARFAAHPVDRFVRAKLDAEHLTPLPRAGRGTLLRRVTFDLTGLPPTPEQVRAFLSDNRADAYERLVDRLLESAAYGERYAQHWLDLARFAETDGFEHDLVRPNAWRYRDWLIAALNADMPYDEFVRLQIAGDLLRPDDPQSQVATGFLLCGPDMPDINLQEERRHLVLNELTATVGATFLAMQFGCAQCHDHKFDPISQLDFYRLRAFFESTDLFDEAPIPTAEEAAAHQAAEAAWSDEDRQGKKKRDALLAAGRKRFRDKNPDERPSEEQVVAELTPAERNELATVEARLKQLPELPELPLGRVVREGQSRAAHYFFRGDFRRPGPLVECAYPRVICDADDAPHVETASRAELARWLTRPERGLTARVIVNRAWQWHFGVGLSDTPSDFGLMGSHPTHPELLDWLAGQFAAKGFRLKELHRLLVTSETYKLASSPYDATWTPDESGAARAAWDRNSAKDPDGRLLWRRRRTRLDGEQIRDALLACSGRLSTRTGGPGVRPPLPAEVTQTLLKDQWRVSPVEEDHRRRSVYLFVRRNLKYPLLDVFDRPDTLAGCPVRHESTTATQALVLFNSQFSHDAARHLAGRLCETAPDDEAARIEHAYLTVYGRSPSADELGAATEFLDRQEALLRDEGRRDSELAQPATDDIPNNLPRGAALVDLCLGLLNSSEFVYVD